MKKPYRSAVFPDRQAVSVHTGPLRPRDLNARPLELEREYAKAKNDRRSGG